MRIVVAHNYYGSRATGGETVVFHQEVNLLRRFGHEVLTIEHENDEIKSYRPLKKITTPLCLGFSRAIYNESLEVFKRFKPKILHLHNYKYVITPAICQAAKDCGVKTVLTLHNYRLICPGGQLRRGDMTCEECLKRNPIRSLWRSKCASNVSSRLLQYACYVETRRPLLHNVDVFIALTEFARQKFIEGGLPASKIVVKPNFVFEPTPSVVRIDANEKKKGAIFVGRLSSEKGVRFLIDAWRDVEFLLTVVGDGPERAWARANAPENVSFAGEKSHQETIELMRQAEFLIFPSVWYEGLPMTLLESCAVGTPILATDLGPRREVVKDGVSGFLFQPGDREGFITIVNELHRDPDLRRQLGVGARRLYEELYTPERNIELLNSIYNGALLS